MHCEFKYADVEAACSDLEARTLAKVPGDFARLIYLASTRDYNSGQYYHEGLARQFTEQVAREALASCHKDVFKRLALCSLKKLVEELETYVGSTHLPMGDLLRAWENLQPYRIAIPLDCSPLIARFFESNVKAALTVLRFRQNLARPDRQFASPRQ
jgi:hypothetical protein